MQTVYVEGKKWCGLGNILFQIATAIYYAEKYGYKIILNNTESILSGTGNMYGKQKCNIPYDKTILRKFTFGVIDNSALAVYNDFTSNKIIPMGGNIKIGGYNQNLLLFKEYMHLIPRYLSFDDNSIATHIKNKYGDVRGGICVGIRIGEDFKHMNKLTCSSYKKALDHYKNMGMDMSRVYIISDKPIKNVFDLHESYNCIDVDESDIVQMYLGIMCQNFILSESTFHLWIAYLAVIQDRSKNVLCFNNSDTTIRKFDMENWIKIEY